MRLASRKPCIRDHSLFIKYRLAKCGQISKWKLLGIMQYDVSMLACSNGENDHETSDNNLRETQNVIPGWRVCENQNILLINNGYSGIYTCLRSGYFNLSGGAWETSLFLIWGCIILYMCTNEWKDRHLGSLTSLTLSELLIICETINHIRYLLNTCYVLRIHQCHHLMLTFVNMIYILIVVICYVICRVMLVDVHQNYIIY